MWDYSQHLNDTLSSNIHPKYTQQRQCIQLNPDLSVLPHSVCYMFLSPPRPSVTKPSGSQLLRFGTLLNKISGYYHPLALSNAVSKLTSFPTPASHVPHLAIRQRLWLELAWICALYKFCNNNNYTMLKTEYNAPLDTVHVISGTVFPTNHLTVVPKLNQNTYS